MDNKKWAAVLGIMFLAALVGGAILLQQRNDAREGWRETRHQNTELERRMAELNETVMNQQSRFSTERRMAAKNQAALRSAESQRAALKALLNKKQIELDAVQSQLLKASGETASQQEVIASAEAKISGLLAGHAQMAEERTTLVARIENLESELEEKAATIVMLEQKYKDSEEVLAAHEKEAEGHQETITRKEKQLAETKDKIRQLLAETEGLKRDQEAMKASELELETRLMALVEERGGFNDQITALKSENEYLNDRILALEQRYQRMFFERSERISELSKELAARDGRLEEMEKEKDSLLSDLAASKQMVAGLEKQLQEVISSVPELEVRLDQSLENYQAVSANLSAAKAQQEQLEAQQRTMKETYEALLLGLKQQLDSQEASIEEYREKLKVTFVDRILFGFSQVSISPEGKAALNQLAEALHRVPQGRISIIGHADSVPVASKFKIRFPSNWELSSARAAAVARHLLNQTNIAPSRVEVIGLSSHHPLADNDTEIGRAKNRRVEIVITPERTH